MVAMSRWGESEPEYFKSQSRIDKRGRKFIEVKKNPWGFDMRVSVIQDEKPRGETWEVAGSKGNTYTVSLLNGRWACTCPGATFRGSCKHIESVKKS